MSRASIHPSQRRFSCEICRRHKSKCQRIQQSDPKCARCTILRVECITGQQKKVGRPKQAADSANEVSKIPGSPPRSTAKQSRSKLFTRPTQRNARKTPGRSEEDPSVGDVGEDGPAWSSRISPANRPIPAPSLVPDAFVPTPTWSTGGMLSMRLNLLTWKLTKILEDRFPLSKFDSTFGSTTADAPSLDPAANTIDRASATRVIPGPERAVDGIGDSDALAKLSKINLELHIRVAAAESNRTILDLNSLIYQGSPLFIDNYTLAVFILKTSQDFVQILMGLLNSRQCQGLLRTSQQPVPPSPAPVPLPWQPGQYNVLHVHSTSAVPYPSAASLPLLAPLALTITSIFTQLISLYELFLEHITTRIERLSTDPVAPIPGITFGGLPMVKPCTQGLLFSNGVVQLLERMERALGISEHGGGEVGLLSPRQVEVLWGELNGGVGIAPADGNLRRPAHVKELLGQLAIIFRRLTLLYQQ
ncbi:hypothetical protein BBP40_007256 [Aspergillus hancockii]|nr:hypothetical protein BBP40_007256 [Aspergillus hancockii]